MLGLVCLTAPFYGRYGRYSLLLSWVPIFGDPITIVAGILREPLLSFVLLVTIAKCARYVFVVGLAAFLLWLFGWLPSTFHSSLPIVA